jgi:chemotaxis protein MotB
LAEEEKKESPPEEEEKKDDDQVEEESSEEEAAEEEEKCPECEKCPDPGAPAWMATFADMATLLMAFFVLILSFAEMNVPKFKQISGSMRNSFGIQRLIPVVEMPKADSIIAQSFSPSKAEPTPLNTIRQDTTDDQKENVELKTESESKEFENTKDLQAVREALSQEISEGKVNVKSLNGEIIVEVTEQDNKSDGSLSDQSGKNQKGKEVSGLVSQETIEMYAKIADVQSTVESKVTVQDRGLINNEIEQAAIEKERDLEFQRIRAELSNEIQNGLAEVEKEGDKVIIRLAEQGSFESGSANLKSQFKTLLSNVGNTVSSSKGEIRIEGHTDNVPVIANAKFKSNWDLSGARAGSVADYLIDSSSIKQGRISVQGFADTKPIQSNDTASGRSKNRRIEIIVDNK